MTFNVGDVFRRTRHTMSSETVLLREIVAIAGGRVDYKLSTNGNVIGLETRETSQIDGWIKSGYWVLEMDQRLNVPEGL